MNTDRDKYLTEAMGGIWCSCNSPVYHDIGTEVVNVVCKGCGNGPEYHTYENSDFSTWDGFGKLWEWCNNGSGIEEQCWWPEFVRSIMTRCFIPDVKYFFLPTAYTNPDRFANAVYEFLKGRES